MTPYVSATIGDPMQPLDKAVRVELCQRLDATTTRLEYRNDVYVNGQSIATFSGCERMPPRAACQALEDVCLRIAKENPRFDLLAYSLPKALSDGDPAKAALLTVSTNMRTILSAPGDLLPHGGGPIAAAVAGTEAAAVPNVADLTEEVFKL